MGLNDHYVASLKGTIYKSTTNVNIVDVSHLVNPFDIAEAAYLVSSCINDFPEGTVHVVGVDSEPVVNFGGNDGSFPSVMVFKGQFIIANDNGFFGSFLKEEIADSFWRLDNVLSNTKLFKFPTKNMLLPAAIHLIQGNPIEDIASPQEGYKQAFSLTAVSEKEVIKGHVVHIDSYGNAITNIHTTLFSRYGDVPFILYFKRDNYFIDSISNSYNEVVEGEKVAIFNENGYIEIAINRGANRSTGGAEKLFGLQKGDLIRIEFQAAGSKPTLESLNYGYSDS